MAKKTSARAAAKASLTGKRVGLYPGTFDPPTLGHLDIVKRALKLVDHLVIGVGVGTGKNPLFSFEERVAMWQHEAGVLTKDGGTIEVQPFGNALQVDFARSVGASIVVRGLRAMTDFEYEFQIVGMNQRLAPDIETVFLMADPRYLSIASKLVKEVAMLGGNVSPFLTPHVADLLVKRCKELAKKRK
ncbi:MAG: pantetheine-phosphate adenylyltransferase [Alphaproteobacteria bacterium]|nr:pantetheine-phosphate adenylyltransferase [Alphaproteobacteria bacterium]